MDVVTLAVEQASGVLAAALVSALSPRLRLAALGIVIVGIVGGGLGGLILSQYAGPAPVRLDQLAADLGALVRHIASGAAGGAALAILTGLLNRRSNR
jgi:hypothetical protein